MMLATAMLKPSVSLQCDLAWAEHQCGSAQQGWARAKRELAADAACVERLLDGKGRPDSAVLDALRKRGMARQRALKVLRLRLPGAAVTGNKDCLEIRWLAPHAPVLAEPRGGERQNSLLLNFALLFGDGEYWNLLRRWLLDCSEHSAWRFLQRSTTDLRAALFAAAAAFAAGDAATVLAAATTGRDIFLPDGDGGGGLFVCRPIAARATQTGAEFFYARAETYISAPMIRPGQRPLRAAADAEHSVATMLLSLARKRDARPPCMLRGRDGPAAFSSSVAAGLHLQGS